jgi:hypothetical protein
MPLTPDEVQRIIRYTHNTGVARRQAQGSRFRQEDFCAGAAAIFFALRIQDQLLAAWIFGNLADKELFTTPLPDEEGGA